MRPRHNRVGIGLISVQSDKEIAYFVDRRTHPLVTAPIQHGQTSLRILLGQRQSVYAPVPSRPIFRDLHMALPQAVLIDSRNNVQDPR
jgi:hypothetical protein